MIPINPTMSIITLYVNEQLKNRVIKAIKKQNITVGKKENSAICCL